MAYEVGSAYVTVMPSARGFARSLGNELDGTFLAAGQRGGTLVSDGVGRTGRTGFTAAGGALGAVFAGAFAAVGAAQIGQAVFGFLQDAVESASNLVESQSKANVVFGDASDAVMQFARTAARSFGQTEQQALEMTGTFGNLLVSLGVNNDRAAEMSITMSKLASDLASFNNIPVDEAAERLRSGLLGEQEAMERLGVSISEAGLKQVAFNLGLTESTTGVLPPAIRTQAAYALILEQTGTAQGDFARTSDNMANRQRILQAEFENTKTAIGTALLPAVNDLLGVFMDEGVPVLQEMVDWVIENKDAIGDFILAVVDGALAFGQGLAGYMEHMSRMADFWLTWTTNLAQTFLNVVGIVIDGAAQMFGWIPGVGDRLRDAQDHFHGFRADVDKTFAGMRDAADKTTQMYQGMQDALSGIRTKIRDLDGANATFTINAQGNGVRINPDGSFRVTGSTLEGRAGGGDVRAGVPYIVGEREAELFVPSTNGRIYNQRQIAEGALGGAPVQQNNYISGLGLDEVNDVIDGRLRVAMAR